MRVKKKLKLNCTLRDGALLVMPVTHDNMVTIDQAMQDALNSVSNSYKKIQGGTPTSHDAIASGVSNTIKKDLANFITK